MKFPLFLAASVLLSSCANRPPNSPELDSQIVEAFRSGYSATAPSPKTSPAVPALRKTLVQLEAEELRIRKDYSVSGPERMRRLRAIWKEQLAVMGR